MRTATLLVLLLIPAQADAGSLFRLAVVDKSRSMHGERMEVVQQELLKVARQLPPSTAFPIALICFDSSARDPRVFTDHAEFERAVMAIEADGGTKIAAGLDAAYRAITGSAAGRDVLVLLYTDGEDSNLAAVRQAEQKLSALFADRHEQGLEQSVFLKRWGNANAELRTRLQQSGVATVLDAAELPIVPITVAPKVELIAVQRDRATRAVEIVFQPAVETTGNLGDVALPDVCFTCTDPRAEGDTAITFPLASLPPHQTLRLVPDDAEERALALELPFSVSTTDFPSRADGQFILPILAESELALHVPLSTRRVRHRIAAELSFPEAPKWADPLACRAAYPVLLTFTVDPVDADHTADISSRFAIAPIGDNRVLQGPPTLTLPGTGRYCVRLVMEVPVAADATSQASPRSAVRFRITPINAPPTVAYDPPELTMEADDLPLPDPVTTTITPQLQSLSAATWVQVPNLASFRARVNFRVDGPVPAGTRLALIAPAGVSRIDLKPDTLRRGEQTVDMVVQAELRPSPADHRFRFKLAPPSTPHKAVVLKPAAPIDIQVQGPRPLYLVNARDGALQHELHLTVPDNCQAVRCDVVPALYGQVPKALAPIHARLTASENGVVVTPELLNLGQANQVTVTLPTVADRPFFRDIDCIVTLRLAPEADSSAILPTRLRVHVTRFAPFKRLLFYLSVPLCALIGLAAVIRTYQKFRDVGSPSPKGLPAKPRSKFHSKTAKP